MSFSAIVVRALFVLLLCTCTTPTHASDLDDLVRELKELTERESSVPATQLPGQSTEAPAETGTQTPTPSSAENPPSGENDHEPPPSTPAPVIPPTLTDTETAVNDALDDAEGVMEEAEEVVKEEMDENLKKAEEKLEKERKKLNKKLREQGQEKGVSNRGQKGRGRGEERNKGQRTQMTTMEEVVRNKIRQERVLAAVVLVLEKQLESLQMSVPEDQRVPELFDFLRVVAIEGKALLDEIRMQQQQTTTSTAPPVPAASPERNRQLRQLLDLLSTNRL